MSNLVTLNSNLKNLRAQPRGFNTDVIKPERSPLEDKTTEYTTKQFGNDQPGYGSSGLPYIKTIVPPTPYLISTTGPGFPLYTPGTTGNPDYPIRGGSVEFQIGQQTYTLSNKIDTVRIRRFLEDPKRGPIFIQKQIGLQLTNPKIETGNTLFGIGQGAPIPGLLENTRVYNQGLNTLAQVGVQGTGAHAIRHGLVPFNAFQKDYFAVVNEQNVNNELVTNRLLNLTQLKMSSGAPLKNPQNVLDINTVNTLGISLNRNLLFQYLGGPGSSYGIGATTISRVVDTTKLGVSFKKFASRNAMTYDSIRKQQTQYNTKINSLELESGEIETTSINTPYKVTDETKTKAFKTQDYLTLGNWGDKNREDRFYYKSPSPSYRYRGADKMNVSTPYVFKTSGDPWTAKDDGSTDDLIKFLFEAINYDDPSVSLAIPFRAFLEGSISDNNNASWNSFKYMGRGENFYTYQGFDRTIGFSFKVAAESKDELIPMYQRVNALVSQVYPDYSPGNIMRAPIIRLTIGDYLYRVPGLLENVNVTLEGGAPWDTNVYKDSAQLAQVLTIQVSFKPIPSLLPRRTSISKTTGFDESRVTNPDFDENEYYKAEQFGMTSGNGFSYIDSNGNLVNRTEEKVERWDQTSIITPSILANGALQNQNIVSGDKVYQKKFAGVSSEGIIDDGFVDNEEVFKGLSDAEAQAYKQGLKSGKYKYDPDTKKITLRTD